LAGSVVAVGDKLHIITRRFFEDETRRHFAGEVASTSDGLYELRGYAFVFHSGDNEYRRRPDPRVRIFSLADAGHIVNKIPRDVDIAALEYRVVDGRLAITDGRNFALDINEFGPVA